MMRHVVVRIKLLLENNVRMKPFLVLTIFYFPWKRWWIYATFSEYFIEYHQTYGKTTRNTKLYFGVKSFW